MKEFIKSRVFAFILGAIIFGSIGVISASTILAKDISYTPNDETWNVNNIGDAIDDLYANAHSKSKIIKNYIANDLPNNGSYVEKVYTDAVEKGTYYLIVGGGGGVTKLSYSVTAENSTITELTRKLNWEVLSGNWYGGLYATYKIEVEENTNIIQNLSANFGTVDNVIGYTIIKE